jgi:poly(3-hydroxyalkanoate) depolymerase
MFTRPKATTTTINVNGTHIYVALRQGDRSQPPLLLINGIGANLEVLDPFVEALEKVGRQKIGTIRFDVPGVGGSPPGLFPFCFRGLARLIAQLLDALEYQEVDVLGVSWGGALAQQFAHQYPRRCRRLVLVATSTGAISIPGRLNVLAKLLSPRRYFQPSYMATIAPNIYGGKLSQRPELARAYAHLIRAPHGLGYYRQLLAGVGWTSLPWLYQLHQPTLILAGNDDPIVPSINAKILTRLIPHARLHIINDGHLLLLSEREQVAPLIYHFLKEPQNKDVSLDTR